MLSERYTLFINNRLNKFFKSGHQYITTPRSDPWVQYDFYVSLDSADYLRVMTLDKEVHHEFIVIEDSIRTYIDITACFLLSFKEFFFFFFFFDYRGLLVSLKTGRKQSSVFSRVNESEQFPTAVTSFKEIGFEFFI